MKMVIFIIALVLSGLSCIGQNPISITVSNPLAIGRELEVVELPISEIENRISLQNGQVYLVKNASNEIIPSQRTFDDKLIFQCGLKARESKAFIITVGEKQTYSSQVFGRHYPERKDDFAWENDRVGFRFYGKKLKEIQAPTSGLDLWYKRTDKLILDEWYRKELSDEASYHVDHGEGCDSYAVGQTLGGGSMAILIDSTLYLNENFDSYEMLDKGPLRITFRLIYPSLNINGKEVTEKKIISLDAGSQLTKIIQEYGTSEEITVAAGFPKRQSGDSILYQKGKNYFMCQEPMSKEHGQIYLGVLIPQGINDVFINKKTQVGNSETILTTLPNIVATASYSSDKPVVYYTGFGWSKFGFETLADFQNYVDRFSVSLQEPLVINYK